MVGKILIVDDVATNRIVQKVKLSAAFYQPILASDGRQCLSLARSEQPDLILLQQSLSDLPMEYLLGRLSDDAATRSIPVIVVASHPDKAARVAALAAGAHDVLSRPVDDQLLLARMRSLIRARTEVELADQRGEGLQLAEPAARFDFPARIALVTCSDRPAHPLQQALAGDGSHQLFTFSRQQALADAVSGPGHSKIADIFVLEASEQEPDLTLRLMSELRSSQGARNATICLIGRNDCRDALALAFDMGADDVFLPSMSPDEITLRLRRLVQRKRHLDRHRASVEDHLRLALVDPLTGLYNRRYAMPQLALIGERALADDSSFAAFVIDIDRFKAVNDGFGHAAGDAVLVDVAKRLSDNLRIGDLLARIGGEEFLAVLPDITLSDAQAIAERLCQAIAGKAFVLADGTRIAVTISIGLAISDATRADQINALIADADQALLTAKHAGRNQVTMGRSAA